MTSERQRDTVRLIQREVTGYKENRETTKTDREKERPGTEEEENTERS